MKHTNRLITIGSALACGAALAPAARAGGIILYEITRQRLGLKAK